MTETPFDEAAVRTWLTSPDPDAPEYTIAESLDIEDGDLHFESDSDSWLSTLEDLVTKAADAGLIPTGTLVWLTCDSEGALDGALVTRTYDHPSLKLCSSFLELRDLFDDSTATGMDAAVSILSAIHMLSSALRLPPYAEVAKQLPCGCVPHVTRMRDNSLGQALWCETEGQAYCNFECPHEDPASGTKG